MTCAHTLPMLLPIPQLRPMMGSRIPARPEGLSEGLMVVLHGYMYIVSPPLPSCWTSQTLNLPSIYYQSPQTPVSAFHSPRHPRNQALTCPHLRSTLTITSTPSHSVTNRPTSSPHPPSSMETTTPCQASNANTNQFLLITTRLLATVGFSYLLSVLYQLLRRQLLSRHASLERVDGKHPLLSSLGYLRPGYTQADRGLL